MTEPLFFFYYKFIKLDYMRRNRRHDYIKAIIVSFKQN